MNDVALITRQDGEFLGTRLGTGGGGGQVPPGDYISADTGNLITVGSDGKLLVPDDNIALLDAVNTFQEHPIVPAVDAQTPFSAARADRYVTESQMADGGVGAQQIIVPMASTLNSILTSNSANFNFYRKNGFVTITFNSQLLDNFTGNVTTHSTDLPAALRPAFNLSFIPIINGNRYLYQDTQQSPMVGFLSITQTSVVFNWIIGMLTNKDNWIASTFTYPHA